MVICFFNNHTRLIMSRVLIWKKVFPGSEMDIYCSTDYQSLYHHVVTDWMGNTQNWGNKLWFQGIMSAIATGENEYEFLSEEINPDQINSDYDFIVLPMANIFNVGFRDLMCALTEYVEKIRIPIYVVACGIQIDSYDQIPDLIQTLGKDSYRFIKAVYNTGGEFALRGYYTKEYFTRLGFPSAVVTGCPSIYQMGPDFQINVDRVERTLLRPVFNGRIKNYSRDITISFPEAFFIDQDELFYPMFDRKYLDNSGLKFQMNFVNTYGVAAATLLGQGRIAVSSDMNDWYNFLSQNGFNYSFGSRIHGTIMALLSGIPATIDARDARTREMAEFFDIPIAKPMTCSCYSKNVIMQEYERMDYTAFNRGFRERFLKYEEFLRNHGIVTHVNTDNKFFFKKEPIVYTMAEDQQRQFAELEDKLLRNHLLINGGNAARRFVRRILK